MKKTNNIGGVIILGLMLILVWNVLKPRKRKVVTTGQNPCDINPNDPECMNTRPMLVNPPFIADQCVSPNFSNMPDLSTDCGQPPIFDAENITVNFGDYSCNVLFVQQQANLLYPEADLIEDGKFGCQTLATLQRLQNSESTSFTFREFFRKNDTTNTTGNWLGSGTQKLEVNRFIR